MDHVVGASVADEVAEHAEAEDERRQDAAAAVAVEGDARADGDDPDAVDPGRQRAVPLTQRQVGDVVAASGEFLGEVAEPRLEAADGPREEAVVDEADPEIPGGVRRGRGARPGG